MYRVSPRFIEELKKPVHEVRVKMEVLTNPGLQIIEGGEVYGSGQLDVPTDHLVDGVIDVNTDRSTRRTFTATVLNDDGQFAPGEDWAGMFYVNRVVRLYRGIQIGDTLATTEWVCVGTFLLDNVDIIVERNISIAVMSGSDFWKKFAKGELAENHKYDKGTHANAIIRELATKCGVDDLNLDPLDSRPEADTKLGKDRSFENQSKYGELLEKIADMFSIDIYFDVWGTLVSEDTETPADKAPVWTFKSGDSIISLLRSSYNDDVLFNGVKVIGTGDKKQVFTSVVYDNDPDSKSNVNRIGRRTIRRETEDVDTQSGADRLAQRLFNRRCGRIRNELSIEGVCLPFFEGDDVVKIVEGDFSNTNARARLVSFTVPLTSSRQTLKARRVVRVESVPAPIIGPTISNVQSGSVDTISAIVTWDVSVASDGLVEYGPSLSYGSSSSLVAAYLTSHAIRLLNLQPATQYHFRVRSNNQAGGMAVSGDYTFTTAALPTGPTISNVSAGTITATTAIISWDLSEVATGQVQFGTTTGYGQWGPLESSFSYSHHDQQLTGLPPSTLHHYRVHSTDIDGNPSVSGDYTFSTIAVPTGPPPPPPSEVRGIYGSGMAMDTKSDRRIGGTAARKYAFSFIAPASGTIEAIRWQRRMGSGYSLGDGGTAEISIQTSDSTGKPTGTQVGGEITYDVPTTDGGMLIRNPFTGTKPNLTAGSRYAVVFRNVHASPASNYFAVNRNLLWDGNESPPGYSLLPFNADYKGWINPDGASTWSYDSSLWVGMDVEYTSGGYHVGMAYHNTMLNVAANQFITGARMVRQRFTVSGGNKTVRSLYVFVGRQSGTSPLTVGIYNSSNSLLDSFTIPYSEVEYWNGDSSSGQGSKGSWLGRTLPSGPLTFTNGSTYYVRLSTATGTQYSCIGTYYEQDNTTDASSDPLKSRLLSDRFEDGLTYEYTTNSGGAWSACYGGGTNGHMPVFFEFEDTGATPRSGSFTANAQIAAAGGADYTNDVVLAISPDAYWPMQEASGNLTDASGNGWTGTKVGSPTYSVAGPTINGEAFNAITFGNGNYFSIAPTLTDPSSTGFTVSAWIKAPADAAYRYIFRKNQTNEGVFYLRKTSWDSVQIVTTNTVNGTHGNAYTDDPMNDTWWWVAARYSVSGNVLRAYAGTATADTSSFTGTWDRVGDPNTFIGATGTDYWDGEMCHLAYWDTPLTDAQMTALRTGVPA